MTVDDRLTEIQADVFDYIVDWIVDRNWYPTFREIAFGLGLNVSTVYISCKALKRKGYIDFKSGKARSMRVTGKIPKRRSR